MKKIIIMLGYLAVAAASTFAQGRFLGVNSRAATRVGTAIGPVANSNILAQFMVGFTTDSLVPVASPAPHNHLGFATSGVITVNGIDGNVSVWVQMLAWDRTLWGESFASVPANQFGRTDIVPVVLSYVFDPAGAPSFLTPAIVPVPEPSAWALILLGGSAWWLRWWKRRSNLPSS